MCSSDLLDTDRVRVITPIAHTPPHPPTHPPHKPPRRDPTAYSPDFEDGLALQRILEAVIASHRADGATVRL